MSEHIEEAIAAAERMLCPKGEPHTGENNRAEHGHMECWVIGELLNEIERLRIMCEQFAGCAKSFGTKYGSDVVGFLINEKKFRKTWEKYKGGAW